MRVLTMLNSGTHSQTRVAAVAIAGYIFAIGTSFPEWTHVSENLFWDAV